MRHNDFRVGIEESADQRMTATRIADKDAAIFHLVEQRTVTHSLIG